MATTEVMTAPIIVDEECLPLRNLILFSEKLQYPCGIITLIISILGVVFNILNIMVLTHVKMRTPVNLLLTFLSVTELLLFTIYIPYLVLFNLASPQDSPRFATDNKAAAYYLLFYADASVFLHLSAMWLIITTAFFRFLLVQFPLVAVKWCTYNRAVLAAVLTVSVSLLLTLPNILRNAVGQSDAPASNQTCFGQVNLTDRKYYQLLPSAQFTESQWATSLNYWLFATVGKFLPCILLLVFTVFLIRVLQEAEVRQQRLHNDSRRQSYASSQSQHSILRKKSRATNSMKSSISDKNSDYQQTTRMLLAVVVSFFVVELPHGIFVLWAKLTDNMITYGLLDSIVDLATLSAFSINFVLYSIMSRQYRQLFIALVMKPFKHRVSSGSGKRKFIRRRSSFRTMHTEHSELHPLNRHRSDSVRNNKTVDTMHNNNNNFANNERVDV